jgi:hypothetical protein
MESFLKEDVELRGADNINRDFGTIGIKAK